MQNIPMHMWIVSLWHKSFLCACKSLYFIFIIFYFRDCVIFKKINEKPWENKNITDDCVLYTNYKAENNAVWTIYVKYGLKSTERFENLSLEKWNFEMKNV